jgi:hypothetical protein
MGIRFNGRRELEESRIWILHSENVELAIYHILHLIAVIDSEDRWMLNPLIGEQVGMIRSKQVKTTL